MRKFLIIILLCLFTLPVSSEVDNSLIFSTQTLVEELKQSEIQYKDVFLAQSILESGHYTSDIFKNGNNLVGMKLAAKRPTTAIGTYKGYAKYSSWTQSLEDYHLWQKYFSHKFKTRDQFIAFLNVRYSRDGSYAKKLYQVLRKNKALLVLLD